MKTILLLFTQLFFSSFLFSEIKANYNGNKVDIYWTLSNADANIDHVVIERSKNGVYFKEIINVEVGKSSTEFYEIDNNPPSKCAYYRVKQITTDGRYIYSETVMVKNFNKMNYYKNYSKALKGFKANDVLAVVRDNKGKEYYLKLNVAEYGKDLIATTIDVELLKGEYLVIASSEDILLNHKILIIDKEYVSNSFYSLNKK